MMKETVTVLCKSCNIVRHRVCVGRGVYRSRVGEVWSGPDTCHKCRKKKIAAKLKRAVKPLVVKRVVTLEQENFEPVPTHHATKRCDKCAGPLPLSRYKTCTHCRPPDFYTHNHSVWDHEPHGPSFSETLGFRISELPLLAGGVI